MSEQLNLILAIVLSVGIILAFQFFYEMPRMRDAQQRQEAERAQTSQTVTPSETAQAPGVAAPGAAPGQPTTRAEALAQSPRVPIDNGSIHGSIALKGGRIDDVTLANYHVTVDPASPEVVLLSPPGSPNPYFAEHGWVARDAGVAVPGPDTLWAADGGPVTAKDGVTLRWDNGQGLEFKKRVEVDPNYMFTVRQSVTNSSDRPVTLYPYGLISRWGTPPTQGFYILHEGPIGVFDETLHEIDYDEVVEENRIEFGSTGGWLGITDKYWLASLVPQQDLAVQAGFRHLPEGDRYQADFRGPPMTVAPGQTIEVGGQLFAGAKVVTLLDQYSEEYGVPLFDRAVDFGWFYFLTKPIFYVLHWIHGAVGNYGIAILILTLVVKALFFPLADKSYRAMAQMKKLQPQMMKLREQFEDDKVRMNQELMALYKREKVNPVSGCLPIVIQIPVFFALYKVLFVTIEMRHAPFFGWVQDLSAPDPTSVFNLFGLLPFTPPHMLMIGIWPLIMGFTMWLQTRLNPQPTDPVQAKVMQFLPLMFIFLFATFPAGLVIYWSWNNVLSIAQQWAIMKRMGVKAT
ncbi:MAG TPA: membrane protein insertase YidC [Geminicoccaceae bacterium]|nr:membrane protein insertase YidC [Geminicoccaceae bacterium]